MKSGIGWIFGIVLTLLILSHVSVLTDFEMVISITASVAPFAFLVLVLARLAFGKPSSAFQKNMAVSAVVYYGIQAIDPLPKGSYLRRFDSAEWLGENTWKVSSPTKRRQMLGSLYWFESHGWKEENIKINLGESSEYFQSLVKHKPLHKVYSFRIDNEDGFISIDSQWLVFIVDKTGSIISKEILTD